MSGSESCGYGDKECMTDLLSSEKYLAGVYNTSLLESATPEMTRTLSGLLSDTHEMQQQIFREMNSRDWYPVTRAEDNKIEQTKQKFAAVVTQ